jgi:hypothetical protein
MAHEIATSNHIETTASIIAKIIPAIVILFHGLMMYSLGNELSSRAKYADLNNQPQENWNGKTTTIG